MLKYIHKRKSGDKWTLPYPQRTMVSNLLADVPSTCFTLTLLLVNHNISIYSRIMECSNLSSPVFSRYFAWQVHCRGGPKSSLDQTQRLPLQFVKYYRIHKYIYILYWELYNHGISYCVYLCGGKYLRMIMMCWRKFDLSLDNSRRRSIEISLILAGIILAAKRWNKTNNFI